MSKFRFTLALRLTLWYAAIFAASSVLAFAVAYALIAAFVAQRTDKDMQQDIDEYAALFEEGGIDRVRREMALDTLGEEAEKVFFRVWTRDARQLAATDLSSWPGLMRAPEKTLREAGAGDEPVLDTLKLAAREDRVRRVIGKLGPGVALELGQSLEDDAAFLAQILRGFLLTLAIVLLCGGPIGWFMARRALRGVKAVTRTADEITHGAFERRVPVGTQGDELDHLARTFNTMLDRIQALIIGMRDMADNLAHDLRSPLARIRASAEMSLSNGEANGEGNGETRAARESLAVNTIEECDRLLAMINTTLDIAEADSGAAKLNLSRVDLAEIVRGACELFQTVAEDSHINLITDVTENGHIQGDRQRLQRAIANLLDNALKYTPAGGEIRVALHEHGTQIVLTIADTGAGISADDLPRIFQRFYRGDRSRSQQGIGLGLNLALAFVRAHGGDITVSSTQGAGSTFTLVLPRTAHAAPLKPLRPSPRSATQPLSEEIDVGT
jgi:heavy metal sensor kinase